MSSTIETDLAEARALTVPAGVDLAQTPEELLGRAEALIPALREQQADAEVRGHYGEDIHREFVKAGFSRVLQPRRFGGYEFDLTTFFRLVMTISRGDPGTGWCFSLGAGHALPMAAYFGEQAQAEVFGPDGEFRAPHRNQGGRGRAVKVDGGYRVSATFDYCSGIPYSTHLMATTLEQAASGPRQVVVVIPRDQYTILDDWGNGATLGMQGSGSNSVEVDDVFVPDHLAVPYDWVEHVGPTPGTQLHGNPMYIGRLMGFYTGEVVSVAVGTARAALDEFEQIARTKKTLKPPQVLRFEHHDTQRTFGLALTMTDAAEAIVRQAGAQYTELAERDAAGGPPFTAREDMRIRGLMHQAGRLAAESVELLFHNAGSSAARHGQRMQRYFREISMFRGHPTALYMNSASEHARVYFGNSSGQPELV